MQQNNYELNNLLWKITQPCITRNENVIHNCLDNSDISLAASFIASPPQSYPHLPQLTTAAVYKTFLNFRDVRAFGHYIFVDNFSNGGFFRSQECYF